MSTRNIPVLSTERLVLTLPVAEDAEELRRYLVRNHEHLKPWSPPEPEVARSLEGVHRRIAAIHRDFHAGQAVRFWLRERERPRGPFLGAASLSGILLGAFRACLLGYHLDQASVGQGLMTEALKAVIRYAFDELMLHRIMANYMPENERSGAVLKRLNFVVEGHAREYLFINGAFRDHVLTALTHPDFRDAQRLCTPA